MSAAANPTVSNPAPAASHVSTAASHGAGATTASLQVSRKRVMTALSACMLLVVSLHLVVVAVYLQDLDFKGSQRLYFDNEGNLPAYFSTFIIFLAAVLLAVIAAFKRADRLEYARHWTILSLVFFGLALDEALSFHEMLIDPMRATFGFSGLMRLAWVLVGGLFAAGFGLAYLGFLTKLPASTRRGFVIAGAIYVTGVLGFEMVSGPFLEAYEAGASPAMYMTLMTTEEVLEMAGILLFISTLLNYLENIRPEFRLRFVPI